MISVHTLVAAARAMQLSAADTRRLIQDRNLHWSKDLGNEDAAVFCFDFIDGDVQRERDRGRYFAVVVLGLAPTSDPWLTRGLRAAERTAQLRKSRIREWSHDRFQRTR